MTTRDVQLEQASISNPFTKFEIQKYYHNESRFNDFFSRNSFPKIKDESYFVREGW